MNGTSSQGHKSRQCEVMLYDCPNMLRSPGCCVHNSFSQRCVCRGSAAVMLHLIIIHPKFLLLLEMALGKCTAGRQINGTNSQGHKSRQCEVTLYDCPKMLRSLVCCVHTTSTEDACVLGVRTVMPHLIIIHPKLVLLL